MVIHAFKDWVTPFSEATMNGLLSLQPFTVLYEGTQTQAKTGAGAVENSLAAYSYCFRLTAPGTGRVDRAELHLDRDGAGADLVIELRSGMSPAGGNDGTLLKSVLIPAEFVPTTASYVSIPINIGGLTGGAYYWLVVKKAGDASNKCDIVGETSQDSNYPAYRRSGSTGAWTTVNALHFKIFAGSSGQARHVIEGENALTSVDYTNGLPSKIYQYIPPSDGPDGGVRDVLSVNYSGGLPVGGA